MAFSATAAAVGSAGKAIIDAVTSVGIVGVAGGGAVAASQVFSYNRENFMEDREQRMKKEFMERKLRVRQAELWREDVRDFVSLTERKMKYYLLINVLLLGFNVNLWCEGRLPVSTPHWLMVGNQVATAGSFMFLLLTVWLSMHSAVSAQSYQARVLTQLVRLPIPTWAELEACRTYGSSFERVDPKQMFRVPFVSGSQEDILRRNGAASSGRTQSGESASSGNAVAGFVATRDERPSPATCASQRATSDTTQATRASDMSADPWGLERRGDDIYELGSHDAKEIAELRHIKIIRQAAVYWQTYDAFARVSMSVGVNQLMLAMSYYILGYVLCQVHCPAAAFAGVIALIATAEVVAQIDLTLRPNQQRLIQVLLIAGPALCSAAAYNGSLEYDQAERIARGLAPLAFFSHGAVLALMTLFLGVQEQENGAMLPSAFKDVLFLDVFGWVKEKAANGSKRAAGSAAPQRAASASTVQTQALPARAAASTARLGPGHVDRPIVPRRKSAPSPSFGRGMADFESSSSASISDSDVSIAQGPLGYYALDYLPDPEDIEARSEAEGNAEEAEESPEAKQDAFRPAVASVAYGADGRPSPNRPDDFMPEGAAQDMRNLPGAPRMWDTICAVTPPAKEFFEPVTFMPPEGRRRRKVDDFFDDGIIDQAFAYKRNEDEMSHIMTGHDNESPGLIPWNIFRSSATLLCLVWLFAGVFAFLDAADASPHLIPKWLHLVDAGEDAKVVPPPSVFGLWAAGLSGTSFGPAPERIAVTWPYRSISPWGLSCDPEGHQLLVTDGLSTLLAEVRFDHGKVAALSSTRPPATGRLRSQKKLMPSSTVVRSALRADFKAVASCDSLRGEAISDTALFCTGADKAFEQGACTAAVLHRRGERVALCPLFLPRAEQAAPKPLNYAISQTWLDRAAGEHEGKPEKVAWILGDSACSRNSTQLVDRGCTSVGTSRGRVVRLRQARAVRADEDVSLQTMIPEDIVDEHDDDAVMLNEDRADRSPGVVRAFNSRYIGVLQPRRKSIRVLDLNLSGSQVGTLMLPDAAAAMPGSITSFCAGGGHIYFLISGPTPGLWRMALPAGLQPDEVNSAARPSAV